MLITVLIVFLLALAIGVIVRRSFSPKNATAPNQAPLLSRNRLQAKSDIEAALDFEAYKHKKETSDNLLQHEMKENQRMVAKQFHNDFEKLKGEIQSGFVHIQRESHLHIIKANEKMQDWIKDLLHDQQKEFQDFFHKTNDKFKQDMQSEIQSMEKHIQHEINVSRQLVKEEIQKATVKASLKATIPKAAIPKASAVEISKKSTDNLEKQLNKIEMTENQLQTNVFNELNHQLADAQDTMTQIHAQLEMLHLLHELQCEFKNQALSMSQ